MRAVKHPKSHKISSKISSTQSGTAWGFSQVNLNDAPAQDTLFDDAKESLVRELGKGIEESQRRGERR
jgi:hypothetical protein